jgi:predicted chitinase
MADNKPINWAYPFKTAGESSKEVTDPQLYFDALANAENGFYPMGANGLWHGGVHFDANTGALLDQNQVRCIADGEVIAYRIDDRYPETPHAATIHPGMGPEPLGAKYSTGFVLVKHRLTLPSTPPPATPADESSPTATTAETPADASTVETEPADEGLIFYSLYMHLLDWTSYQAASAPKPPVFLAPSQYSVKTTADDPLLGLRVRALHDNGTSTVLALLPKGCKVTLGETHPLKPQFKQLLSVDEGAAIPALPADTVGWVYAPELTGNTVADKATDTEQALTLSHQGLRVRKEGKLTGAIIGVLPRGATLKVGEKQSGGYCKVLDVMDYRGVPALPNGPDGKPLGYVYFDELETQQTEPRDRGHAHLLPEPHTIKAGELIGHIGLYQNQGEGTAQSRLHLEVFSCEDVPTFIAKSRTIAASLPAEQKTLLKIHKRASKLIPHREDISASNPPKITDPGVTIAVELTIPVSVLESLPAERKIQVSETVPGSPTPRITRWWRLDDLLADAAGNRISGWLAEQDLMTSRHSPWEWEGFDFISETTCAADHLACHLAAQRLLTEDEQPDYQAQISTADHGPIKTRLYDIIDGADGSVRNDILSVREIKAALSKPWHAQSISRLITHYESEWFWQDAKWDELDKLMEHTEEDPNPQWIKEKERIKKLCWWEGLAGKQGINAAGRVWHFHAPMLVTNFRSKKKNNCHKCNKEISITYELMKKICPTTTTEEFINEFITHTGALFEKYEINSCTQVTHLLAQAKHETKRFTAFRESLYYSSYTAQSLYNMAPTAINNGFTRKGLTFPTQEAKLEYIEENLLRNDVGYGQHCFGSNEYPDNDYRGRGLLHLTHYTNYHDCSLAIGKPIDAEPTLVQSDVAVIVETGLWFWKTNRLKIHAENTTLTEDEAVKKITRIINGAEKGLDERKQFKREITEAFIEIYGSCSA